jgi:hypothetical protein
MGPLDHRRRIQRPHQQMSGALYTHPGEGLPAAAAEAPESTAAEAQTLSRQSSCWRCAAGHGEAGSAAAPAAAAAAAATIESSDSSSSADGALNTAASSVLPVPLRRTRGWRRFGVAHLVVELLCVGVGVYANWVLESPDSSAEGSAVPPRTAQHAVSGSTGTTVRRVTERTAHVVLGLVAGVEHGLCSALLVLVLASTLCCSGAGNGCLLPRSSSGSSGGGGDRCYTCDERRSLGVYAALCGVGAIQSPIQVASTLLLLNEVEVLADLGRSNSAATAATGVGGHVVVADMGGQTSASGVLASGGEFAGEGGGGGSWASWGAILTVDEGAAVWLVVAAALLLPFRVIGLVWAGRRSCGRGTSGWTEPIEDEVTHGLGMKQQDTVRSGCCCCAKTEVVWSTSDAGEVQGSSSREPAAIDDDEAPEPDEDEPLFSQCHDRAVATSEAGLGHASPPTPPPGMARSSTSSAAGRGAARELQQWRQQQQQQREQLLSTQSSRRRATSHS